MTRDANMTPPVPAEAVARLTAFASVLNKYGQTQRGSDIETLLAAYADAARDRERFRNYGDHTETCDSWGGVSTDPSGCSCGFNAAWYAAFPEDRVSDAARTGEAR